MDSDGVPGEPNHADSGERKKKDLLKVQGVPTMIRQKRKIQEKAKHLLSPQHAPGPLTEAVCIAYHHRPWHVVLGFALSSTSRGDRLPMGQALSTHTHHGHKNPLHL